MFGAFSGGREKLGKDRDGRASVLRSNSKKRRDTLRRAEARPTSPEQTPKSPLVTRPLITSEELSTDLLTQSAAKPSQAPDAHVLETSSSVYGIPDKIFTPVALQPYLEDESDAPEVLEIDSLPGLHASSSALTADAETTIQTQQGAGVSEVAQTFCDTEIADTPAQNHYEAPTEEVVPSTSNHVQTMPETEHAVVAPPLALSPLPSPLPSVTTAVHSPQNQDKLMPLPALPQQDRHPSAGHGHLQPYFPPPPTGQDLVRLASRNVVAVHERTWSPNRETFPNSAIAPQDTDITQLGYNAQYYPHNYEMEMRMRQSRYPGHPPQPQLPHPAHVVHALPGPSGGYDHVQNMMEMIYRVQQALPDLHHMTLQYGNVCNQYQSQLQQTRHIEAVLREKDDNLHNLTEELNITLQEHDDEVKDLLAKIDDLRKERGLLHEIITQTAQSEQQLKQAVQALQEQLHALKQNTLDFPTSMTPYAAEEKGIQTMELSEVEPHESWDDSCSEESDDDVEDASAASTLMPQMFASMMELNPENCDVSSSPGAFPEDTERIVIEPEIVVSNVNDTKPEVKSANQQSVQPVKEASTTDDVHAHRPEDLGVAFPLCDSLPGSFPQPGNADNPNKDEGMTEAKVHDFDAVQTEEESINRAGLKPPSLPDSSVYPRCDLQEALIPKLPEMIEVGGKLAMGEKTRKADKGKYASSHRSSKRKTDYDRLSRSHQDIRSSTNSESTRQEMVSDRGETSSATCYSDTDQSLSPIRSKRNVTSGNLAKHAPRASQHPSRDIKWLTSSFFSSTPEVSPSSHSSSTSRRADGKHDGKGTSNAISTEATGKNRQWSGSSAEINLSKSKATTEKDREKSRESAKEGRRVKGLSSGASSVHDIL
ncbi:hypothetical protein MMC25_007292 [Agyrium rufum]|nr:hypothetical protein [Agyrium rufum]